VSERSELEIQLDRTTVKAGESLEIRCTVGNWPDPKASTLEVRLEYVGDILAKDPSSTLANQRNSVYRRTNLVGVRMASTDDIDPLGNFTTTMTVPAEGPGSSDENDRRRQWRIAATLNRRGRNVTSTADLTVEPLTSEQRRASRALVLGDSDDLAPLGQGGTNDLAVSLDTDVIARGDTLHGKLILNLDPIAYTLENPKTYMTKRGRRKGEEQLAALTEIAITDTKLLLACERSYSNRFDAPWELSRQKQAESRWTANEIPIALPATIDIRKHFEFPFEVSIDTDATPTSYGLHKADTGSQVDEHTRWVVIAVLDATADPVNVDYSGTNRFSKDSPLRAAAEVIVV
jgi:hypothetical protein